MEPRRSQTPNFDEDIFINYAHDDNLAPISTYRGWIDTMHESLLTRLTQLIGERPAIWRDVMMGGNDPLSETIVLRLSKTAFLVSVLSPSYVNSKWCKDELSEFYKRAAENGGIKINNRSRIFKVMKTPIGDDPRVDPLEGSDLPHDLRILLQESLGYEFYETDIMSGRLREFWPELGPDYLKKFLDRLEDLAQDIKEFIKSQQSATAAYDRAASIYLAETTPELCGQRNEIKRALQQHHYRVLPDENLPFEDSAFEERVSRYLDESILSIHLIGSDCTVIPAEEQVRLKLDLQHQLAAERVSKQHELAMSRGDNDPQYYRLIWMPEDLRAQGKIYQQFVAYLQNDPGVYECADVLSGVKLEDLKTIIQKKLKYHEESAGDSRRRRVYLKCGKVDMPLVAPLRDYLENERQYEVLLPFKGDSDIVSGDKDNLRLCDALLIFYGTADTIDYQLRDFGRIDVIRDGRPLLARGIYVSGPETERKKGFHTDEALVMKNFGEFSPESIKPLIEQLERSLGTRSKGALV
ncbi:MAG TPA: toll/interleukin-1 receptor domain-containing protein [Pyrinomonadaceae bacterium]|jgi:hypothetical protein